MKVFSKTLLLFVIYTLILMAQPKSLKHLKFEKVEALSDEFDDFNTEKLDYSL